MSHTIYVHFRVKDRAVLGWSKELHRKAVQSGFSLRYEGSPLGWRFRDLQASQWLARDEIRDLQWRKLRALVHHAYSHVPYYRRIMDDLGIGPEAIRTPQDYARLPILTKAEVNAHREEMVAENFPKSRLIKTASGGSTGAPVALYHDPEMVASYRALKLRNFQWVGWRPGDAWVRLWGSAFDVAPHQALRQRLWDKVGRVMVLPCFEMSDKTMERYARALASFEPDIIEAYVTPMHLFARFLQARGGPTIRPRGIICSAEMLFSHQRELIQEVFGCKVFNRYGGREMGDVAHECEAGSMHINAESIYVEFIRDGRPAEPGVPGEIILTALDLYGMPLLRYQVEDIGAPRAGGCPCGRGLPTMEMVEGRIQDIISLKSGRYLPGEFFPHLFKDYDIVRFQVVQESLDSLIIKMVPGPGLAQHQLDHLAGVIKQYTDGQIDVSLELVDVIPLTPSGKFRYTISKVPLKL